MMHGQKIIKLRKLRRFWNENVDLFLVDVHMGVFSVLLFCGLSVRSGVVSKSSLAISRFV